MISTAAHPKGSVAHHFVPQWYLKNFGDKKGLIWVYDKSNGRVFHHLATGIAHENHFHHLAPDILENDAAVILNDQDLVEKAMTRFEDELRSASRLLVNEGPYIGICPDIRHRMGFGLAIQYLRTRSFRDQVKVMAETAAQNMVSTWTRLNYPKAPAGFVGVTVDDDFIKAFHLQALFDQEMWIKVGKALESHAWILVVSPPDHPFVTSDHPVARRHHKDGPMSTGFRSIGLEVFYPLTPKLGVLIVERTFHRELAVLDGGVLQVDSRRIKQLNEILAANAERFIYGSAKNFTSTDEFFQRNKGLRSHRWDNWTAREVSMRTVDKRGKKRRSSLWNT
ncbi:MAG: DUF4238 domain-containing protein [Armatimonadetes bacterium]|nr:DUF4238 domain-containing protein [Armatimonadota bacterium]